LAHPTESKSGRWHAVSHDLMICRLLGSPTTPAQLTVTDDPAPAPCACHACLSRVLQAALLFQAPQ
jgi:hypothetical protein